MSTGLRFLPGPIPPHSWYPDTDHICGRNGKALCGFAGKARTYGTVTWDALHEPRWTRVCPKCRQAAILLLRPKAEYWFISPFRGTKHTFRSLRAAEKAARTEHGTVAVYQLGPGEINKIVKFVNGLDPLP